MLDTGFAGNAVMSGNFLPIPSHRSTGGARPAGPGILAGAAWDTDGAVLRGEDAVGGRKARDDGGELTRLNNNQRRQGRMGVPLWMTESKPYFDSLK